MLIMMKNEIAKIQSETSNEDLRGLRYRVNGFIECMNMFKDYYSNLLNDIDDTDDC